MFVFPIINLVAVSRAIPADAGKNNQLPYQFHENPIDLGLE